MTQCDRIREILKENRLKQKELAESIGVTEGYISVLLKKPEVKLSRSVAGLIEEKFGYSSDWVLTGSEPKIKYASRNRTLSDIHRRALARLEKMTDEQAKAVLAFINSLDEIEKLYGQDGSEH